MPTIADVAARAGVGVGTVSRVLNESPLVSDRTRARVLAVIAEMNYRPSLLARSLSTGTVGVLAAVVQRMTTPSALQRLRGILDAASTAGFDVILHNVNGIEDYRDSVMNLLRPDRCSGGLLVSIKPADDDIGDLVGNAVPVVIVDGLVDQLSSVYVDDEMGGRLATEHLIGLGHKRIAFVGDWEDEIGFRPTGKRLEGYRNAMAEAALETPDAYVATGSHAHYVTHEAINRLLDMDEPPTAVVAAADSHAMVIAEGARARGVRVPEDLAVIGYDDVELAEHVGLSTIRQPLYDSGAEGVRMLLDVLNGRTDSPQHIELPLELMARASTAPPGGRR